MEIKFTANLHSHTVRCNHANGTEREYIERALSGGLTTFGFSDHAPYAFPDGYYSGFRMLREVQKDYIDTLIGLKEEYSGRIDIKLGYEMEYYPKYFCETTKMITQYPVDYVILGQHFTENEIDGVYAGGATDDEDRLAGYVDQVNEALDTGFFTYVAHPDNLNFTGDSTIYDKHYSRLIEHAKKLSVPLEINFLGIRESRHYPNDRFFSLCGEIGAPVCIGCDAHTPINAYDPVSFGKAKEMIGKYGLKYVESPSLKKPREIG